LSELRLGIVGLDTSHCIAFTRILNNPDQPDDDRVDGARVTHAWAAAPKPGEEATIAERSQELTERWGVRMVRRPASLVGKVDAVLLLSVDGSTHVSQARPLLGRDVPLFIDKPFTNSVAQARALVKLVRASSSPVMSCSALRYAEEVTATRAEFATIGEPIGGCFCGPGTHRPGIPGSFFYGIHAAEMMQAVMGAGVESVRNRHTEREDVVTVAFRDGRSSVLRFVRDCPEGFWFSVTCPGGRRLVSVDKGTFYVHMLRTIVGMIRTGAPGVPLDDTFEIVALLEACDKSGARNGAEVKLARP